MRHSEESVCAESDTMCLYIQECVWVRALGYEVEQREPVKACFSHSHSRACERSVLSANSIR